MIKAKFIRKLNRFVGEVFLNQSVHTVYIPNTGRVAELFIPGREVILVPNNGKYSYKIKYILFKNNPVMIDSIYSNRVVKSLLISNLLESFKGSTIIKSEPVFENHRFDFLLEQDGKEQVLEVKSCTLAWKNIASFPDAPTERGQKHVERLSLLGNGRLAFFIFHQGIEFFIPNYHTDFKFYKILKDCYDLINVEAYSVIYNDDYEVTGVRPVKIILPEILKTNGFAIKVYKTKNRGRKNFLLDITYDSVDIFKKKPKVTERFVNNEQFYELQTVTIVKDKIGLNSLLESLKIIKKIEDNSFLLETNPLEFDFFWDWVFKERYFEYIN